MRSMKLVAVVWLIFSSFSVAAQTVSVPNTFQAGQPASASEVNENFDALEEAAARIAALVSGNTAEIGANNGRISSNTASITAVNSKADANARSIGSNTVVIQSNSSQITANSALINSNSGTLNSHAIAINTNTLAASANSTGINSNALAISSNATNIEAVDFRTAGAEANISALDNSVAALDVAVSDAATRVTTLESQQVAPGLMVQDGNGQIIGRFISFTGTTPIRPSIYWLLSAEGYYFAVRLGPSSTAVPPADSGGSLLNQEIWYSRSGCTGDAYLEVSAIGVSPNNGYVFDGGGGSGDGRQFYVPAGATPVIPTMINSRKGADTVCQGQSLYGEAYLLYPNDEAVTGVSTAGYTLPLTLR